VNKTVIITILVLIIAVGVFAYLNAADSEDRLRSQREAEIYIEVGDERMQEVDFDTIMDLQQHEFTETLQSSDSPASDHDYRGILMKDLLEKYDLLTEDIEQIITRAADGYTVALGIGEVMADDNVYIVYEKDGKPLAPKEEGGSGPYMVVIREDEFGQRWNKFLMELQLQ